jgi:hypothetical protein
MNKNIGFILIKLQNTTTHDKILQTIKQIEDDNIYGQTIIFNSYSEKIETYNLPILHLSQAQFFHGKLIIFDLASILLTQKFPNIDKRLMYTNSLPWVTSNSTMYEEWKSLYFQDNLDFIVDSQATYDIYNTCWKQPLGIVEGFEYEKIKEYL